MTGTVQFRALQCILLQAFHQRACLCLDVIQIRLRIRSVLRRESTCTSIHGPTSVKACFKLSTKHETPSDNECMCAPRSPQMTIPSAPNSYGALISRARSLGESRVAPQETLSQYHSDAKGKTGRGVAVPARENQSVRLASIFEVEKIEENRVQSSIDPADCEAAPATFCAARASLTVSWTNARGWERSIYMEGKMAPDARQTCDRSRGCFYPANNY